MVPELPPISTSGDASTVVPPEALHSLLVQAGQLAITPKSKTIFCLGARGHYENATSDLLAFFLSPREEHGFGAMFLRIFFDCLGINANALELKRGVSVSREERLKNGQRLDLLLRGAGWVLAIENKVRHTLKNDFAAYAAHVQRVAAGGQAVHRVLLTARDADEVDGWATLTYRTLCPALLQALDELAPVAASASPRWPVLAREFVRHLIQEFYPTAMSPTPAQTVLLEAHLRGFGVLQELFEGYVSDLKTRLTNGLEYAAPSQKFPFQRKPKWALVWEDAAAGWCLSFQTPAHPDGNPERRFRVGLWLRDRALAKGRQRAADLLADLATERESNGTWWARSYADAQEAEKGLFELARQLFGR